MTELGIVTEPATPGEWERAFRAVQTQMPARQALVAWTLKSYAHYRDGTRARPGNVALAREAGCGRATVSRALRWLRRHGWIMQTARAVPRANPPKAAAYRLSVPVSRSHGRDLELVAAAGSRSQSGVSRSQRDGSRSQFEPVEGLTGEPPSLTGPLTTNTDTDSTVPPASAGGRAHTRAREVHVIDSEPIADSMARYETIIGKLRAEFGREPASQTEAMIDAMLERGTPAEDVLRAARKREQQPRRGSRRRPPVGQ